MELPRRTKSGSGSGPSRAAGGGTRAGSPSPRGSTKRPEAGSRSTQRPAKRPTIFISYRHADPTTRIASKLYQALLPPADTWGANVFMDDHDLEPADLFDAKILAALDRTTHFIALLNNSYWSSDYCRQEMARVVERYEGGEKVRLLFVKVEELDPNHFKFNKDRTAGRIRSRDPIIEKIGDVQFLGPFDGNRALVRLAWESEAQLSDQLAQLVKRLERVIE